MNSVVRDLQELLGSLKDKCNAAAQNDAFPQLQGKPVAQFTPSDINKLIENISNLLESNPDFPDSSLGTLNKCKQALQGLVAQAAFLNNGHIVTAILGIVNMLTLVHDAIKKELPDFNDATYLKKLAKLRADIRALEAGVQDVEPRLKGLDNEVEVIAEAATTARELPLVLKDLSEARTKLAHLLGEAQADKGALGSVLEEEGKIMASLRNSEKEANKVIDAANKAYQSGMNVGLAKSFSERAKQLTESIPKWVVILVGSLAIGGLIGHFQLKKLGELLTQPSISFSLTAIHFTLSILSVGGAVWLAWLSTKQIGQRFRLAEDYAFKAAISSAYEGYRKEASTVSKELEVRLLESALSRFDEQPLRWVENVSHGSPWHELSSSPALKEVLSSVPGGLKMLSDAAKSILSKQHKTANDRPVPSSEAPPGS